MQSFTPGPPDAQLVLQAAVTKTASFTGAWYDLGLNFAPGGLGMPVAGVVNVSACDRSSGDETYAFKLEQADDDGTNTGTVDSTTIETCSVPLSVVVSGTSATLGYLYVKGFITRRYVRLTLTAAGTTPSITYSGLLNP